MPSPAGEGQPDTPINRLKQGEVMTRIERTVFISYRHANIPWALAIYQNLTSRGFDVFFDYLSIKSGDFEQIILGNIKARAHFIVILTPSALERCNEPGDWFRREIETALDERRNVIPLMLEGFDFGSPSTTNTLTGKLENLKKYNGLRIYSDYFFEGIDRLCEQFMNVSLETVIHPVSENTKQITEEHQVAANRAQRVEQKELTAQEWFEKGKQLSGKNDLENASHALERATTLSPSLIDAWDIKIQVELKSNKRLEAAESITKLIKLYKKQMNDAETQYENEKDYWISQSQHDALFENQSISMSDYYDNEVLAHHRDFVHTNNDLTDKIKSLEALLKRIKSSE